MANKNVYEMVTERIITELKKGHIPWRKTWSVLEGAYNRVTKKPYSLINQLLLKHDGEYATFSQWKQAGGHIRKGEKGEIIVFWKIQKTEFVDDKTGENLEKFYPVLRYYTVFHITQVDNVQPVIEPHKVEIFADEKVDAVIDDYVTHEGIKYEECHSDKAFYRPSEDFVCVPERESFSKIGEFYSTAFHELVHSTGHKTRLNRSGVSHVSNFGSETYSKEELIAEIGSACALNSMGIETPETFTNSVAYIQSWISALENDEKMIVQAASKAEKAIEFIFGNNGNNDGNKDENNDGNNDGNSENAHETENMKDENQEQNQEQKTENRKDGRMNEGKKTRHIPDRTIINRIMKDMAARDGNSPKKPIKFDYADSEFYGYTDGYRILATKTDFGNGYQEHKWNIEKMLEPVEWYIRRDLHRININREAVAYRVRDNKERAKKHDVPNPFIIKLKLDSKNTGYIGINPSFLLDALDFVDVDYIYIYIDYDHWKKDAYSLPIFVVDDTGEKIVDGKNTGNVGLILPVNINGHHALHHVDQEGSYEEK